MEAELSADNARVLAGALQCIGKVAKDVYMELDGDGITLRAIDDANTTFFAFYFRLGFFMVFRPPVAASASGTTKTKFSVKAALGVFRNMRTLRSLRMMLATTAGAEYLVVQLKLDSGAVRTHAMTFEEQPHVEPVFASDAAPHRLRIDSKHLLRFLDHLRSQDVTVDCGETFCELRSGGGDVAASSSAAGGGGGGGAAPGAETHDGDAAAAAGAGASTAARVSTSLLRSRVAETVAPTTAMRLEPDDFLEYSMDADAARALTPGNSSMSITKPERTCVADARKFVQQPWSIEWTMSLDGVKAFLAFLASAASAASGSGEVTMRFSGRDGPLLLTTVSSGERPALALPFAAECIIATNAPYTAAPDPSDAPLPPAAAAASATGKRARPDDDDR